MAENRKRTFAPWIKICTNLSTRAEVVSMSRIMSCSRHEVVGCCVSFWSWTDQEAVSGFIKGSTTDDVDVIVDRQGFAKAMLEVDWLAVDSDGLFIPNYDRHNGKSAKSRALNAEYQAKSRASTEMNSS